MYLTQHERSLPITVAEIALQFNVPHNHLVKVSNKLVKLGLVSAVRGRNGGLRLALPADEIKLGQVLQSLEDHGEVINCQEPPCPLNQQCGLKTALDVGMRAFYAQMNHYSLADVSAKKTAQIILQLHKNLRPINN